MEEEQPIKVLIDRLMADYKLDAGLREIRLRKHWNQIVGDLIGNNTLSLNLQQKSLYIRVNSPVLRSELSFHKHAILQKVNDFLGSECISEIFIK